MQALQFHIPQRESYLDRRGNGTGVSTPWGKAQSVYTYARGVKRVVTAGHGGIGISLGLANKACLSHAARRFAELKAGNFWFEEDCNWAIAVWELGPTFWPFFFADNGFEPDNFGGTALLDYSEYTGKERIAKRMSVRRYILQTISAWTPEYLIEIGEEHLLTQPEYGYWQERKRQEEMRAAKSPHLITSAMNKDGADVEVYGEPVTLVYTADGKHHVVRRGTYDSRSPFLPNCDILDSDVEIDFY